MLEYYVKIISEIHGLTVEVEMFTFLSHIQKTVPSRVPQVACGLLVKPEPYSQSASHCIRLIHVVLGLVFSEFISIGKLIDLFTWRSSKTTLETVKLEPTLMPRTHFEWFQNYIFLWACIALGVAILDRFSQNFPFISINNGRENCYENLELICDFLSYFVRQLYRQINVFMLVTVCCTMSILHYLHF